MNNFFQNRIHLTLKTKATVVRQPVLQVTKSVCVFMMVQARLLLQKMLVPAFLVLYTRRCQYSCISVTVVYKYHFASSSQLTSHYARVHFKSNRKKIVNRVKVAWLVYNSEKCQEGSHFRA
jgi:hypothetical protein